MAMSALAGPIFIPDSLVSKFTVDYGRRVALTSQEDRSRPVVVVVVGRTRRGQDSRACFPDSRAGLCDYRKLDTDDTVA